MLRLYAWLGTADLNSADGKADGDGPIAAAIAAGRYDEVVILANQPGERIDRYSDWLRRRTDTPFAIETVPLADPANHRAVYEATVGCLTARESEPPKTLRRVFHLSPGTPAMHAIWMILGLTRFPADFIQSSREHGVVTADVPFAIAAEFLSSDVLRAADRARSAESQEVPPEGARFGDILYRSPAMDAQVRLAKRTAARSIPVLIEGESGTGKELFARAIHNESPRATGPMRIVNCGAIPAELIESEFFGHRKGAFTGAAADRDGAFVAADGGTLFLDEIGELPLAAQVRLLRALQEGEVVPVGSDKARKVDVRIIAATNRSLIDEVRAGRFREDLFYRLAVGMLKLPALRERQGDLMLLSDALVAKISEELLNEPGARPVTLSPDAKKLILRHPWPGNVRELANTIRRAALFCEGDAIGKNDMERALLPSMSKIQGVEVLPDPDTGEGFDLGVHLDAIEAEYLDAALKQAGGNKSSAARLLGFANSQTYANRLRKHGLG